MSMLRSFEMFFLTVHSHCMTRNWTQEPAISNRDTDVDQTVASTTTSTWELWRHNVWRHAQCDVIVFFSGGHESLLRIARPNSHLDFAHYVTARFCDVITQCEPTNTHLSCSQDLAPTSSRSSFWSKRHQLWPSSCLLTPQNTRPLSCSFLLRVCIESVSIFVSIVPMSSVISIYSLQILIFVVVVFRWKFCAFLQ